MQLLIGLIIGFLAGKYWQSQQKNKEIGNNIESANAKRHKAKESALNKVIALFNTKEELTNNDVEQALNISDATATNYLKELEEKGLITQIGDTGRGVIYKKK